MHCLPPWRRAPHAMGRIPGTEGAVGSMLARLSMHLAAGCCGKQVTTFNSVRPAGCEPLTDDDSCHIDVAMRQDEACWQSEANQ